eukprot:s2072_g13.t1
MQDVLAHATQSPAIASDKREILGLWSYLFNPFTMFAAMEGSRSRSQTPETHMPMNMKFCDFQEPLDSTTDGSKTPSDQEQPASLTNMKLVFGLLERGLPSLHRGYRTPDPSPTRTGQGLPKCGAYQEFVEEEEEPVQKPCTQRGRQPAKMKDRSPSPMAPWMRLQTPSPEPVLPMPALPQDFIMQQVKNISEIRKTCWADIVDVEGAADEAEAAVEDGKGLQYPLCISFGSQGHPFNCGPACKYASKVFTEPERDAKTEPTATTATFASGRSRCQMPATHAQHAAVARIHASVVRRRRGSEPPGGLPQARCRRSVAGAKAEAVYVKASQSLLPLQKAFRQEHSSCMTSWSFKGANVFSEQRQPWLNT